ncbi:WALL-ASSOCIATED RECEPTOR KINASE-LIKE 21 [Salix koriyanagi]|uniref:WALL-ASSOCIATED RECEPTOR KINASE-LIKE 21 n=1 Tax=Salix koriyanagi TaxID=2511006 RepID=A0A9Q0TDV9_9ROSI|nr:WALL-ASSOCIATED RECEPTOR KINASE-LIKE 21 [Salix koriyanagi]
MILQQHTAIFLAILATSLIEAHASIKFRCNRTCGTNNLPYPFGFSSDCDIHFNCSPSGQMLIHEFPVQIVGQNSMKIILEPKCNRPFEALDNLFTKNYAPKSTNAILLHNCTSAVSPCNIPSIKVQTHFESLNCSNNSNLSCFSKEVREDGFFDYSMAKSSRCQYLLSSISAESFTGSGVSLEIQMMELWWWLQGDCRCSKDAICTQVKSPAGSGFRCQCRDGLVGDGYLAGVGCRKASAGCNSAKYLSGKCGGGSGVAVLLGGVVAGVGVSLGLFCCLIRRNSASKAKSRRKLHLAEAADINIPIYPYKEIEKATNSFSAKQRIGTGAYGTVYAGKLSSDSWVAIKRIKHGDMDNIEQNEVNLAALAADKISRGRLDEIIDPFLDLHSDAWTFSSVHKVAEVAFRCLAFHKDMRPSMVEVAAELEQIMLSRWASSEETNCPTSLDFSPCSSSSNVSEKPLNLTVRKTESERRGLFVLQTQPSGKSPEVANRNSPVSVQDPWLSEKSSPSSSNLLNNVIIK